MSGAPEQRKFSWANPQFAVADALTASRLVLLPGFIYALARRLPVLGGGILAAIVLSDLIDGHVARLTGRARDFGAAFDSAVDFAVIYTLFTAFFIVGLLPWWKWIVILIPGLFLAVTQLLYAAAARDVVFALTRTAKLVGQIQYVYLLLLTARRLWRIGEWAQTADDAIFVLLAPAIAANTWRQMKLLLRLCRDHGRPAPPRGA